MKTKRARGKNYTEEDKHHLLQIVQNYKSIVENKKTDNASSKQKMETWDEIAEKFNACRHSNRTAFQLKTFYENYKAKLRKGIVQETIKEYLLSDSDKERLVHLVEQFKGGLKEENLWTAVTTDFNYSAAQQRTELYLRNAYNKHVNEFQKELLKDKMQVKGTGGGPPKQKNVTENEERIINEDLQERFTPLENPYDSSASFFENTLDNPHDGKKTEPGPSSEEISEEVSRDDAITTSNSHESAENVEITTKKRKTSIVDQNCRKIPRWTKLVDMAYNSIVNSNKSKTNLNLREEEFLKKYNKMKLELLEVEINAKKKEHEERLLILELEKQLKQKELRLLELKVKREELLLL